MIYAGVGARSTPPAAIQKMEEIAFQRARNSDILRSGGAAGADSAFERGARRAGGMMTIYTAKSLMPKWAADIAAHHHPNWNNLGSYVQKLMTRNVMILLGTDFRNMDQIVEEVICWTPGGQVVGGTGHTLRVAQTYNIPIRNLWKETE